MKKSRYTILACLVASSVVLGGTAARAAAGGLDPSFGTGGTVITPYSGYAPVDAVVQPDGKIVVAVGLTGTQVATELFGLLRYQANGAVDSTFGSGGRATTSFTNFLNDPSDVIRQPDGRLILVGDTRSADGTLSEFAIARFTATGAPDSTFGTGGKVTTNFVGVMPGGVSNPANAGLVQSDGKILVGGSTSTCARCGRQAALARYNSNGSLDSTFGTGGMVTTPVISQVSSLAEDAAGNVFAFNGAQIVELNAAGAVQPQVTPAPVVAASSRGFDTTPTAIMADGRYLISGTGFTGVRRDVDAQVVRYQQIGVVDGSFSNPPFDFVGEGVASTDVGQAIAVQPDGKAVVVGYHFGTDGSNMALATARLTATGSLDTTFGTGGVVVANLPDGGQGSVAVIQPDGKILTIGQGFSNTTERIVIIRYLGA